MWVREQVRVRLSYTPTDSQPAVYLKEEKMSFVQCMQYLIVLIVGWFQCCPNSGNFVYKEYEYHPAN